MSEPINMVQLVEQLPTRARGRACVVLTREYGSQNAWAAELARQTGAAHVNLLERFSKDNGLSNTISQFLVPKLFDFLPAETSNKILVVSGIEFLKATWSGQVKVMEQFAARVETWNLTPCLVFVLQYDKSLAAHQFRRFKQHTFIVNQEETLALI